MRRGGIGRRFGARLHEVGRIVDHRGEVALGGAAEIVVWLVFDIGGVVDRRPEILRPQAARAGHPPTSSDSSAGSSASVRGIVRLIVAQRDARCGGTPAAASIDWISRSDVRGRARVRRVDRHVDDDRRRCLRASRSAPRPCTSARCGGGQAAAAVADENDDRCGRLPGSRSDGAAGNRSGCSPVVTTSCRAGCRRRAPPARPSSGAEPAPKARRRSSVVCRVVIVLSSSRRQSSDEAEVAAVDSRPDRRGRRRRRCG